jgi:hypothetical protein
MLVTRRSHKSKAPPPRLSLLFALLCEIGRGHWGGSSGAYIRYPLEILIPIYRETHSPTERPTAPQRDLQPHSILQTYRETYRPTERPTALQRDLQPYRETYSILQPYRETYSPTERPTARPTAPQRRHSEPHRTTNSDNPKQRPEELIKPSGRAGALHQ